MAPDGKMGRPRGFAEKQALEAAMRVFWEKGYEGATLADLTEAMGINRSSMYAAFGDKEALFRLAIARYAEGPARYVREALKQPTVRAVVEALLRGALELLTDPSHPRGCLSVQGALACGSDAEPIKQAMIEWRKQGESDIQNRLQRARREGDLAKDVDAGDLARYISTLLTGLGVQAANGSTRAEMTRLVDLALRSMPF
ncbi:MAG TPA: TetR/AcrR family transcriptional regulator [Candidatus Acidoferrales bacterium]|jgi:AcrR family transcriptional regulator|nr:TetR/AcrR family transcriptional regulator [Candidatus Acidoferrales bacterium]